MEVLAHGKVRHYAVPGFSGKLSNRSGWRISQRGSRKNRSLEEKSEKLLEGPSISTFCKTGFSSEKPKLFCGKWVQKSASRRHFKKTGPKNGVLELFLTETGSRRAFLAVFLKR